MEINYWNIGFTPMEGYQSIPDKNINAEDTLCMQNLREILTPDGTPFLQLLYALSGKSLNQLGNPEMCRDLPTTEYVMLRVNIGLAMSLGLCVPSTCQSHTDFAGLKEFIEQQLNPKVPPEERSIHMEVKFPYQEKAASVGVGGSLVFSLLAVITVLGVIGSLVEYIPMMNKSESNPSDKPDKRLNVLGLALFSFSFKNNLEKLFAVSDKGDQDLKILNGIRVFSICWIIAGHALMMSIGMPLTNVLSATLSISRWYFVLIPGGFFAVDVFFYMSGFLTFYLLTLKMYPKRGCANFPMLIFHRWFILFTPALFCVLLANYVFHLFRNGPFFNQSWNMNCNGSNWWASLLFINNIVPWGSGNQCMSWFWYLANDFEFFLISPLIIFTYCRNRICGYIFIFALMLGNIISTMVLTAVHNLGIIITMDNSADFFDLIYMKPWSRFAAYGVGALLGFLYYEYKQNQKAEKNELNAIENQESLNVSHEVRFPMASKIFTASKDSSLVTYICF